MFVPGQVIILRRSNSRAFFPQLATWYDALSKATIQACRRVGQAVTIALRHFGDLPDCALERIEAPY
eukprot:1317186-Alexandrium_andersonii.AAC.1